MPSTSRDVTFADLRCSAVVEAGGVDEAPMTPRFGGGLLCALPILLVAVGGVGCQSPPVEGDDRVQGPTAAPNAPAPLPASATPTASSAAPSGGALLPGSVACAGCAPVSHPGFSSGGCYRTGSSPGLPSTSVPIGIERCEASCCPATDGHR
jgi:hypothetical protein